MKLSTYTKLVLLRSAETSLVSGIITAGFYSTLGRNEDLIVRLFCGFLVGFAISYIISLYFAIIDKKFGKGSFLVSMVTNSVLALLVIFFVPILFHMIFGIFSLKLTFESFISYVKDAEFFWGMVYGAVMATAFMFIQEISLLIGPSTFRKFLTGRYHKPREEEAVVMFLDLNNSTAIAERLGEIKFISFISDFFRDLSEALIITGAEIHKYVGDEAILIWKPSKAFAKDNCYKCFFLAKESIARRTNYYMKKYGVVPDFKAGMHFGSVVFGEVGVLLKEIACLGDVLNTAARITSECREKKRPFLMSNDVATRLSVFSKLEHVGEVQLRGKEQSITLYGAPIL